MNRSVGRPAGGSDARERIIDAARRLFLRDGYAATSVRGIAREAGVDHTLVNYHFGSKEGLFGELMVLSRNPADVIQDVLREADLTELPRVFLTTVMDTWESPEYSPPMRAMMLQAVAHPEFRPVVTGFIEKALIERIQERLSGRDARQRATAAAMVIAGIVLGRYVFEVPPFTRLTREEVLRYYTPALAAALAPRPRPA